MKIGKTDFNEKAVRSMSYKEFESLYKNILKGDLKGIFKQLGGKIETKSVKQKEKDDGKEA